METSLTIGGSVLQRTEDWRSCLVADNGAKERRRPEDDDPFMTIIAPFDECANCGSTASENVTWNRTGGWTCASCGESDFPEAAE